MEILSITFIHIVLFNITMSKHTEGTIFFLEWDSGIKEIKSKYKSFTKIKETNIFLEKMGLLKKVLCIL